MDVSLRKPDRTGARLLFTGAAIAALVAFAQADHPRATAADEPCRGRVSTLLVRVRKHLLLACEDNQVRLRYRVALGSGGVGKRREGDGRTPLGEYTLGDPRPSDHFHTFVPIDYPTPDQARQNYTGGDLGIHGPARAFRWAGALNAAVDWTQGCIALPSDAAIDELADWVKRTGVRKVSIE